MVFFDRKGSVAAKWFKKHDIWLFGKLYTTMRRRRIKTSNRAMRMHEKPEKKAKKPSETAMLKTEGKKPFFGFLFKK